MMDPIFRDWVLGQLAAWRAFAPYTDRVQLTPIGSDDPPTRFVAHFNCKGLVRLDDGTIQEADRFVVGIQLSPDHLRRLEPLGLVWLIAPRNVWHPNVEDPVLCPGHLSPGVGLIDLCSQIYAVLTYKNVNLREPLNPLAVNWAREHRAEFPLDRRPLRRRETASPEVCL